MNGRSEFASTIQPVVYDLGGGDLIVKIVVTGVGADGELRKLVVSQEVIGEMWQDMRDIVLELMLDKAREEMAKAGLSMLGGAA